jgi:hypothetical protein
VKYEDYPLYTMELNYRSTFTKQKKKPRIDSLTMKTVLIIMISIDEEFEHF